jgi:hypothetical protein
MQTEWAGESLRLAETYRVKTDEELRELAVDFGDLTEPAQQALRAEMHSRRLGDPAAGGAQAQSAVAATHPSNAPLPAARSSPRFPEPAIFGADPVFGDTARSPRLVPDDPESGNEETPGETYDYTWKTVLCECESADEAQQLVEALQKAGLDGWVQASHEFGRRYARILVAADQLEQAKAIAAQPIPQDVLDESKAETPEFAEPKCPKCGAEDPTLESVEPENHWHCDDCGYDWSDLAEIAGDTPAPLGN